MGTASGKGNWKYSGIPGLEIGESNAMKTLRKKAGVAAPKKKKYTSPDSPKATMPVLRPGQPYQKDKNVNKIYKTY